MMLDKQEREWAVEDIFQYADVLLPSVHQYWDADDRVATGYDDEDSLNWREVDSRWEDEADLDLIHQARGLRESIAVACKTVGFGWHGNNAVAVREIDGFDEWLRTERPALCGVTA